MQLQRGVCRYVWYYVCCSVILMYFEPIRPHVQVSGVEWKCPKCSCVQSEIVKKFDFCSLPNVLIVSVKRFQQVTHPILRLIQQIPVLIQSPIMYVCIESPWCSTESTFVCACDIACDHILQYKWLFLLDNC